MHLLLKREGWRVSRNRVYRLYAEEQLQLRSKLPRRHKMVISRRERCVPMRPDGVWGLDFLANQLADGSRSRALTIVNALRREALAIDVGKLLRTEDVVSVLNRLVARRRAPRFLFADNGIEFSDRVLDMWAYHYKVRIDFSRSGKPTDKSFIETFNGSFRDGLRNSRKLDTRFA
jgi:putative transposase